MYRQTTNRAQPRSYFSQNLEYWNNLEQFGTIWNNLKHARAHARIPRAKQQCPKQDPHLWSGKGDLKDLLVASIPSLLAISLGKGQNGTEIFVPLKSVPDMASQPMATLGTHMGDHWSANVATTLTRFRLQPKLVDIACCSK